jgi:hypothetical protein
MGSWSTCCAIHPEANKGDLSRHHRWGLMPGFYPGKLCGCPSPKWTTVFFLGPCSSKSSKMRAVEGGTCSSWLVFPRRDALTRFHHSAEYLGTPPREGLGTITPSLLPLSSRVHLTAPHLKSHDGLFWAVILSLWQAALTASHALVRRQPSDAGDHESMGPAPTSRSPTACSSAGDRRTSSST